MQTAKKKIKVVVVDDSNVILHSLKTFLEDYDFDVLTCFDGLEGIQKTAEFLPDLIFLDLLMPNFDGIKMLQVKKVLKDIKDIPVVVISANTNRKNVLAAMEAGANKVISKPLQKEVIIKVVDELLGGQHFSKKEENKKLSDYDNRELKNQLVKFFIDSFDNKEKMMKEAINLQNEDLLKMVVHEIKGAGGTMGHNELTELSKEIEDKKINTPTDWVFVELKCDQISQKVRQIKDEQKLSGM
ncbi:MAG: response regulator [bacterium]